MANIQVDHSQFGKAASAIESYATKHRNQMRNINNSVLALGNSWQGKDYNQLKNECQQLSGNDSTSEKMLKSLENYADFLRFAESKYKSAQSNAVNRANGLPRF